MITSVKHKRGTTSQWASSTYILKEGELGVDLTLSKLKVGNGTSTWGNLPFISALPSEIAEIAQDAIDLAIIAGTGISKSYSDPNNTLTLSVDTSIIASKQYVDDSVYALGNTSDLSYPLISQIGQANGLASLDSSGKIPTTQIPASIARGTDLSLAISDAISTEVLNRNTAIATAIGSVLTDSGWNSVSSLFNNFSAVQSVAYRKINGIVYMRGNVTGGTPGAGAFTLPDGYRPAAGLVIPAQQYGTANIAYVTVGTDGVVAPSQSSAWLSSIMFPVG